MKIEYTSMATGDVTWEAVREALKKKLVYPGDIIELKSDSSRWRVLDVKDNKMLIWKYTMIENHIFNENGSNVYEGSDIQKYLQNEFRETIPEDMLELVSDEGFFLLTVDQIEKYLPKEIDRIAADSDGDTTWWWLRSPSVGNGDYVRYIYPAGNVNSSSASNSYGVAPACWLNL